MQNKVPCRLDCSSHLLVFNSGFFFSFHFLAGGLFVVGAIYPYL